MNHLYLEKLPRIPVLLHNTLTGYRLIIVPIHLSHLIDKNAYQDIARFDAMALAKYVPTEPCNSIH